MATLLERVNRLIADRETEREQIKARREAELLANGAQILALKKAQRKLLADGGELDALLSELTVCGLWPPRE